MLSDLSNAFSNDKLRSFSILYLALPSLIFLFGWVWWIYAFALGSALCVGVGLAIRSAAAMKRPAREPDWRLYGLTAALLFAWLSLSGIGGFGFQNGDWLFRNSVLLALVTEPWPAVVSDGHQDRLLVSYIAYYLPAALAGKLGQATLGGGWWLANAGLWLWSCVGVVLALGWLRRHSKNDSFIPVLLLIAFGGVDLVGWWFSHGSLPGATLPVGNWAHAKMLLHYPGFTPQLYWVPHQALAAWIAVSLILHDGIAQRTSRNVVFIGAIALLWSPFITLGAIPYAVWVCVRSRFSGLWSAQNAIGLAIAGITALFLISVDSGRIVHGLHWSLQAISLTEYLAIFALFLGVKFGLYAVFVRQTLRGSAEWQSTLASLFWTAVFCLVLIPTYQFGRNNDFCMRVSLPSLFVILILVSAALRPEHFAATSRRAFAVILSLLLVVGSWGAVAEGLRSARAIRRDPAIWPPGVPIEEVSEFSALARQRKLFGLQYTAPLDTAFVRILAPSNATSNSR